MKLVIELQPTEASQKKGENKQEKKSGRPSDLDYCTAK